MIVDIPSRLSSRQRHLYEQLRAEDAEVRSQAGGSREPNARRSRGGLEAAAAAWRAAGRGPSIVSSVLLMAILTIGAVHFFYDAFIWKLRKAEVAASLAGPSGSALVLK